MTEILLWFCLSQTLASLPAMTPGTEVKLVHPDLVSVFDTGVVENGQLAFAERLEPDTELRLLFLTPDDDARQSVDSVADAPSGRISSRGSDILVQFAGYEAPVSFRRWLDEERGIELVLPEPEEGGADSTQDPQRSEDEAGDTDER